MMIPTDDTDKKQSEAKPWQFKPGQSGNLAGRPLGSRNKATLICEPVTRDILSHLLEMPHTELKVLLERICSARWGEVALLTSEQRIEAAKLRLWHAGLTEPEIFKALPALKEAMDREIGKAPQSIAMKVENKGLSDLSTERLLRLEAELARQAGQEPLIIRPMPSKLSD